MQDLRNDILRTAEAFHRHGSEGDHAVVEHLIAQGYDPLRAEILLVFVPLGLARAVIARLKAKPPIKLPDRAFVWDPNGNHRKVPLSEVPEFVSACLMGEENFTTGLIPREHFSASCRSVELNLLNQMLDEEVDIGGADISPTFLLRVSEAPGFEEWYQEVATGFPYRLRVILMKYFRERLNRRRKLG